MLTCSFKILIWIHVRSGTKPLYPDISECLWHSFVHFCNPPKILSRHRHRLVVHRLQRRRSPHIWCTPSLLGLSYPKIIKQIIVLDDMIIPGNIYFYFPCLYKSSQMIFFLFVIHIVKPVGKPFFLRNGFSVCPFYLINKVQIGQHINFHSTTVNSINYIRWFHL